nr:MFS transporter [Corynebacterium lactis]
MPAPAPELRLADGRPVNKKLVLVVASFALIIAMIDITALNVALPVIQRDLAATTGQLQWVIDIYMVVLASILMLAGSMGDRHGRRKAMAVGLGFFALGSVVAALAPTPLILIVGRGIQALGGALMPPVALAIISSVFTDKAERARAIGVWGALMGVGMAAGPLLGGVLVEFFGWRSVFWVNVPLSLLLIALVLREVPESKAPADGRFDVVGQLLAIGFLGSVSYAIISSGEHGVGALQVGLGVLAVVMLAVFVVVEMRVGSPMIDFRFFASAPFSLAILIAAVGFMASAGFQFVFALYLQNDRGLSPLQAGLMMIPLAGANSLFATVSGRLVASRGNRLPFLLYALMLGGGAALAMFFTPDAPIWLPLVVAVLMGAALGSVNAPTSTSAVSGMPPSKTGLAGSVLSTGRQAGQSLGVAIFGSGLNQGLQSGQSISAAAQPMWWIVIVVALICAALGVAATSRWAAQSQERVGSW